jgi:hypothetical protein
MKPYIHLFGGTTGYVTQAFLMVSMALTGIALFGFVSCSSVNDSDGVSDLEQAKLMFEQLMGDPDNLIISFPSEDPGIPIYARVGPILNQFFISDGRLVIPFYRAPDCIRDDFDLLSYYDPPAAFGCELTVEGKFVIEKEADEGTFPIMTQTVGSQVPVWIVNWAEFQGLMENNSVTLTDIEGLHPVKGVAQHYEEYLSPRMHEHEVIIEANGTIPDTNQQFTFVLTHRDDQIEWISLNIE